MPDVSWPHDCACSKRIALWLATAASFLVMLPSYAQIVIGQPTDAPMPYEELLEPFCAPENEVCRRARQTNDPYYEQWRHFKRSGPPTYGQGTWANVGRYNAEMIRRRDAAILALANARWRELEAQQAAADEARRIAAQQEAQRQAAARELQLREEQETAARLRRQEELRRTGAAWGNPSRVRQFASSMENPRGRTHIVFCNSMSTEAMVGMVREEGGILFPAKWVADGFFRLRNGECTYRYFGNGKGLSRGYVSLFKEWQGHWVPHRYSGEAERGWQAEFTSLDRDVRICWPTEPGNAVDTDSACQEEPDRNLLFTHWFSTSGYVHVFRITLVDDGIRVFVRQD